VYTDGTSTLTTYYFAGGTYEVRDDGTTGTVWKYYAFAGMTVAVNDGSGLKYLLTDHLGSIVAVTNASGALLSEQRYLPFGQVRTDAGSITETDFGYTGQRNLDAQGNVYSLGLMDYKARFYDAALMRFTQADSVTSVGTQGLNRYSYGLNNPSRYTDPSGHMPCQALPGGCKFTKPTPTDPCKLDPDKPSCHMLTPMPSLGNGNGSSNNNTADSNTGGTPTIPTNPTTPNNNEGNSLSGSSMKNPNIYVLAGIAWLIHGVSIVAEIGIVWAEVILAAGTFAAPEVTVPLEILLAGVGAAILDFDISFASYTYRVYKNPDVYQKIILTPPWGFNGRK
jgi:RHS repeat-associated protein